MHCIVNEDDPLLEPFFGKFSDLWSRPNQAQAFGAYVRGLISETHRKNIQAINSKIVGQRYQSLHHFVADSPWDCEASPTWAMLICTPSPKAWTYSPQAYCTPWSE